MKKTIFFSLLALLYSINLQASVYASLDEARRGISLGRGDSEAYKFTESVGQLRILRRNPDKDGCIKFAGNATLIRPDMILTVAHAFEGECRVANMVFYDDVEMVVNVAQVAIRDGRKPENEFLTDGSGLKVSDVSSKVDISSIRFHPTYDVAIAKLTRPIARYKPLSMMLDRPFAVPTLAHLVSTNRVYVSGRSDPVELGKRHLCIFDFDEYRLLKPDGTYADYLSRKWEFEGELEDATHTSAKFKEGDPKLLAYHFRGDSGSPLIVGGDVIGVLQGYYRYSDKYKHSVIVPLYRIKEWILSFLA